MRLFSFVSAFFSPHHSWRNPWSPSACSTNINSARALFLAAEVTRVSSTLFPAHTFLILILQTASYTHACWLTLIYDGCGVLRSTRVLHTMLKRPGTRSNRFPGSSGLGSSVKTSSSKPLWMSLFCWTQRKIFWRMWETEQFWGTIDFHSIFFPTMEVNGAPKQPGYKLSSKYLPLCSSEHRNSYRFWNYLRVSKWWQNFHFWVN